MPTAIQESLNATKKAHSALLALSEHDRKDWSPQDQQKYTYNLNNNSKRILKAELVMSQGGNGAMQQYEGQLRNAARSLEDTLNDQSNLRLMVSSINNGLGILDELIELVR